MGLKAPTGAAASTRIVTVSCDSAEVAASSRNGISRIRSQAKACATTTQPTSSGISYTSNLIAIKLREPESAVGTALDHHGIGVRCGNRVFSDFSSNGEAPDLSPCELLEPEGVVAPYREAAGLAGGCRHRILGNHASGSHLRDLRTKLLGKP